MRAFYSIIILSVFLLGLWGIDQYNKSTKPVTLISDAVKPDIYLLNSKLYVVSDSPDWGMKSLVKAIQLIEGFRHQYDENSQVHIDKAMDDLTMIREDLHNGYVNLRELNNAYVQTLNALTYAQIREAEIYVQEDKMEEAKKALKYAMVHIQNALKFSEGEKKEYEIIIYSEMDSIVENSSLTKDQIFIKLEHMLDELEDLEVAYE